MQENVSTSPQNFNTPDNVVFLPEFPKNPTGKVVKRLLKENLAGLVPV